MKGRLSWGLLVVLMALVLTIWDLQTRPVSSQSLMPTFVPTPVQPTVVPDVSFRMKSTQQIATKADLKIWMETYLYPKGHTFLQQIANQWLEIKGTYRRFAPPGSRLPSEGHIDRWIRINAQGKIQEILVIEESTTGEIVQITYARGSYQWNSLGGQILGRPLSLEDLIGWNPAGLWDAQVALPLIWQERPAAYMLLRQVRYSPPVRRFGQYMVQRRQEVWEFDKNTGFLLRHHQRMQLQDGNWITLWEARWHYVIQPHLPESRLDVYNYAVNQWSQITSP